MTLTTRAAINFETADDAALWNHELDRIARLLSTAEELLREVGSPKLEAQFHLRWVRNDWLRRRDLWLKAVA